MAATAPTTLKFIAELLRARAEAVGTLAESGPALCQGAFAALSSSHPDKRDEIVRATLVDLRPCSEVVILAHASMARVVGSLPFELQATAVLSSPGLAFANSKRSGDLGPTTGGGSPQ